MRLAEKYRPVILENVLGQEDAIRDIKNALSRPEIKPFMLIGPAGSGKTTTAYCISRFKYGDDWFRNIKEINASDECGIDTIRKKIIPILRVVGERILLMDEADNLTEDAQQCLRRPLELTKGTMVIFNVNNENNMIEPIKSRCVIIRFKRLDDKSIKKLLFTILNGEGVKLTYTNEKEKQQLIEGVNYIIKSSNGDMRRMINILEKLINEKKQISVQNLIAMEKPKLALNAMLLAIQGQFDQAQHMIEDAYINNGYEISQIIQELYEGTTEENIKTKDLRIRILIEIGILDTSCHTTFNPIYQLNKFIAHAYLFPHLQSVCPALKNE